jgi:outer membrane protein
MRIKMRQYLAILVCCNWLGTSFAQQLSIEPERPNAPLLWRPYSTPEVPPIRLMDSSRLHELIRAGKLYLTEQDAIALTLENNIDLEVSRYNPIASAWRLERAQAGGALPGVPNTASQVNSVASGQGVQGTQQAAGVSTNATSNATVGGSNATISQIGPVTQVLDPIIQESTAFSHKTIPSANSVLSLTSVLVDNQRTYSGSFQQGFLTGGNVSLTYNNHYLNENAPSDLLNPSVAPTLSIGFQHNLLRGFGVAVNSRTIEVARINVRTADLNFRSQLIDVVAGVLNLYHSLAADYEDVKSRQSAYETAKVFVENSKRQVELGSLSPTDLTLAENQAASTRRDLIIAQTSLRQQELQLKSRMSRTGIADPLFAAAEIVPVDPIVIPEKDDLPPIKELVQEAMPNRSDLEAQRAGLRSSQLSGLGTENGILPTVQVFGGATNSGLAGTPHVFAQGPVVLQPDPYLAGGIGNALGQILRRNFPTQRIGAFGQVQIYNRQAQADYAIDVLQLRQSQLSAQKSVYQVQVDIQNAVIALQQARVRYEAATKNRALTQALLDAEQRRYELGASTPYNVIQQQRDLAAARASEISALAAYGNARVSLDQGLGTTLENNHVSIREAQVGLVTSIGRR